MRLILRPSTVLVEPFNLPEGAVLLPDSAKRQVLGIIRDSAHPELSVGDKVLYHPKAGLRIKSNGSLYLLLDAGDILARLGVG